MKEIGQTYIDHDGSIKNTLNMSSIYSKLIKICARDTLSFNSDLFIDYKYIDNLVKNISIWKDNPSYHKDDECEYIVYTLAFRDNGVDSGVEDSGKSVSEYRKLNEYNSICSLTLKHFFSSKRVEAILEEVKLTKI